MIRLNRVLTAAALLFASLAAHAVDETFTFESISSVEHAAQTNLTGVRAGDTVSSSISVPLDSSVTGNRCAAHYGTMLENQAIYNLSVTLRTTVQTIPGGSGNTQTVITLLGCRLELKP